MLSTCRLLLRPLTILIGTIAVFGQFPALADEPVHAQVLLRSSTSWDGSAYTAYPTSAPELTVLKITIPAHASLPWHTHPIPNAGYVVSGELMVERRSDGKSITVRQGDVLPELVGQPHRGVAGNSDVVLIVFYAGSKGLPLSEILPDETTRAGLPDK